MNVCSVTCVCMFMFQCVLLAYLLTSPYNTILFILSGLLIKPGGELGFKLTVPCFASQINFPIWLKQQSLVRNHTKRD